MAHAAKCGPGWRVRPGLAIVAALADKLGHDITASGQTVWAEIGCTDAAG